MFVPLLSQSVLIYLQTQSMKKDINFSAHEGIRIAIARKKDEPGEPQWNVFLLNQTEHTLQDLIIVTKGYGEIDGEKRQTATFRHYFEQVKKQNYQLIEPIDPALFILFNEFWVSYYVDGKIYDKRCVFAPGSMEENQLQHISFLDLYGALHQ